MNTIEKFNNHVMPSYGRYDLVIDEGSGRECTDENGKTYIGAKVVKFKDNCGIAKATLNGKKISSGKKISKKGSYKLVVTDINGLKTTVSFKIK